MLHSAYVNGVSYAAGKKYIYKTRLSGKTEKYIMLLDDIKRVKRIEKNTYNEIALFEELEEIWKAYDFLNGKSV